ncbi:MAG: TonB-dependent receptor plug domain-containing protein, partial [Gammaproteobacteria bacterium]|nr:TonB-dependent receptor plug domain-containing protein [Gammaproteobacteria bacterium]
MKARAYMLALIGAAMAAPGQAAVIEEIVVTAQKREQNAQDVGIAISALTGEQMRQLGYGSAQQVTAMAPGVQTVQPNGEANYAIAMRGVASSDFTTNVESPVAVYLDEVYISQMSGTGFMLFDMERVELLRGPQGTLYGRNATGGLAHFVTVKPSQEASGYGQFTVGRYDQIKFEGAVGGP